MDETIVGRPAGTAHRRLWLQARAAAVQAYAPYSGLRVGAALATAAGATFTGVNVENASYPVGLCAERAALAAAVTAGERQFAMLAVATDSDAPILPCGACLQALAEFGELDVVVTAPAPDTAQPNTAQPNTAQPNTAQPNTAQPNTAQPNARSGAPIEPRVVALRDLLRAPFRSPRELT